MKKYLKSIVMGLILFIYFYPSQEAFTASPTPTLSITTQGGLVKPGDKIYYTITDYASVGSEVELFIKFNPEIVDVSSISIENNSIVSEPLANVQMSIDHDTFEYSHISAKGSSYIPGYRVEGSIVISANIKSDYINTVEWNLPVASVDVEKSYEEFSNGITRPFIPTIANNAYQIIPEINTVRFESNGGSIVPSQSIVTNGIVTRPTNPLKDGYTFAGWYSDEMLTKEYDFTLPVTSPLILYAKWVEKIIEPIPVYTVTFNSNGGSKIPTQNVLVNEIVTKPDDPVKTDAVFAGWYSDEMLTKEYDFTSPVTSPLMLYAKWTERIIEPIPVYTVTFNSNGGSKISTQDVLFNGKVIKPDDPVKTDAVFAGWYSDEMLTKEYDFTSPVTGPLTLYAKWKQDVLTTEPIGKSIPTSSTSATKLLPKAGESNSPVLPVLGTLMLIGGTYVLNLKRKKSKKFF